MIEGPQTIGIPTCQGCDYLDVLEWRRSPFHMETDNTARCGAKGMNLIAREWVPLTPVPSWCPFTDDEVTT